MSFAPQKFLNADTAEKGGTIDAPLLDTKAATLEDCVTALRKVFPYIQSAKDAGGGTDLVFANHFATAQADGKSPWQAKFAIYDFIKAIGGEDLTTGTGGNGKEAHDAGGFHLPVNCWIPGGPGELAARINTYAATHSAAKAK